MRLAEWNTEKLWIPGNNEGLPVHSRISSPAECCDGCQWPHGPWRDCSGTWRPEGLTHTPMITVTDRIHVASKLSQGVKCNYILTSVMWDPLYAKGPGLPVKKYQSGVDIHRKSLSAISHHLHLKTEKYSVKGQMSDLSHVTGVYRICVPPWFTWKVWTGNCLAGFLTDVTGVGVGSGGGWLGCTAKLWLVTASCNAFSTLMDEQICSVTVQLVLLLN